ncbi:hypothetical protein D9M68_732100 [compost metagenome]
MIKIGIFYKPAIHKEKLFATGFLCKFGFADIALQVDDRSLFLYRDEALFIIIPKKMNDPLF